MISGLSDSFYNYSLLIESLFKIINEYIQDRINDTVILVANCFSEKKYTREFYTSLAREFANILKSVAEIQNKEEHEILTSELRNISYQIFSDLLSYPIDLSKEDDIEYANKICECVFSGYASIIQISDSDFINKNAIRTVDRPVRLMKQILNYDEATLFAFCDFINTMIDYFPKRLNMLICRDAHYTFLLYAQSFKNESLNIIAKNAWNRMKMF